MTAPANTSTIDETAPAAQAPDRLWLYALLALVATAGFFYVNIMAAIVDGLITGLGFSNAQAGTVGAANIYGASVGSLLAVLLVRRLRWRPALFALLARSEEHTSELQSLMRISSAVFCFKKKNHTE